MMAVAMISISCADDRASLTKELYDSFVEPPMASRPFVRWWWNGARLSAEEIVRELDVMKEAGIGGVEINTIRFPGGADLGIPSMDYMSPEWVEMVRTAIIAAEKRGMNCDIIVGSGWPFGAEFLPEGERTQLMTKTSRKLVGPAEVTVDVAELLSEADPKVGYKYPGQVISLYSLVLAPSSMDVFAPAEELSFDKDASSVTVKVPAGEHVLYALVKVSGFQSVINGAPGASGPVLNHYDKGAVEHFLQRMSDNLFPAVKDTKGFRALFCDSMELEGANWCDDFPKEFKSRKGYDITPYLPFILYKVGHMGHAVAGSAETLLSADASEEVSRARYDFFTCCMELMQDRFLKTFNSWCDSCGFKSRVQAYGREFHPIDASFDVAIPECETWFWHPDGCDRDAFIDRPAYTNVNKSVASAVHFKGERLVSCEEITNTSCVFNASLERMKMVGDQSNLSGVTHSILHGFNYSPPDAPFPGWVQYGTYLNEKNLFWPYFRLWADYKARISSVLMNSDFYADIALMLPLGDLWTELGPQRDPFPAVHYPEYADEVWASIHRNGNACDYVSEKVLQGSRARKGNLVIGERKYPVLMLVEVESMMPETALAIKRFVASGGKLVLVGKTPCKSVGLLGHEKNDALVDKTFKDLLESYPKRIIPVNPPRKDKDITDWFSKVQAHCGITPYVEIERPSEYVSQIRHVLGGTDIFFFVNSDPQTGHIVKAKFHSEGVPVLWAPETGERMNLAVSDDGTVILPIEKAGSRLIVFEKFPEAAKEVPKKEEEVKPGEGLPAPEATAARTEVKKIHQTVDRWDIRFDKVDGTSFTIADTPLFDLSKDPRTADFAGVITYNAKVKADPETTGYIDLGKVFGVSETTVNGRPLGVRWYGGRVSYLPEDLAASGELDITVKVTTTLGNYMKSLKDNQVAVRWTSRQSLQPVGMLGPVLY